MTGSRPDRSAVDVQTQNQRELDADTRLFPVAAALMPNTTGTPQLVPPAGLFSLDSAEGAVVQQETSFSQKKETELALPDDRVAANRLGHFPLDFQAQQTDANKQKNRIATKKGPRRRTREHDGARTETQCARVGRSTRGPRTTRSGGLSEHDRSAE